jgi:hypothetical protein
MKILQRRLYLAAPGTIDPDNKRRTRLSGWWVCLVVILVALMAVIQASQPAGLLSLGNAHAKAAPPRETSSAIADAAAKRAPTKEQAFDYFPDHYINQAKQAAESIDTF